MDIVDEIIDLVEHGQTVSFSASGSVYQIEPMGDEWMFSVDGGLLCYACETESVRECITDECDPDEITLLKDSELV